MNEKQIQAGVNIFGHIGEDGSFEKLPKELQEKSLALGKAFKRISKATKQHALWQSELRRAEVALKSAQDDHGEALNRWDPNTNTMTEELEDAPAKDSA